MSRNRQAAAATTTDAPPADATQEAQTAPETTPADENPPTPAEDAPAAPDAEPEPEVEPEVEEKAAEPAPTSAVIDPPPVAEKQADPLAIPATYAETVRDRITESQTIIRDPRGNRIDPEGLFSEPNEAKMVRCRDRLIQHETATLYNRHVETVLVPAGAEVSLVTALAILAVIEGEPADEPEHDVADVEATEQEPAEG